MYKICKIFKAKILRKKNMLIVHKTLPRSSAFVNWTSVRFYETGCIINVQIYVILRKNIQNCLPVFFDKK